MANPLTGKAMAAEVPSGSMPKIASAARSPAGGLVQRLSHVDKPASGKSRNMKVAVD